MLKCHVLAHSLIHSTHSLLPTGLGVYNTLYVVSEKYIVSLLPKSFFQHSQVNGQAMENTVCGFELATVICSFWFPMYVNV